MDNQCFGSGPFIWTERVEGRWPVEEVMGKWWGKSWQAVSGERLIVRWSQVVEERVEVATEARG